MNGTEAFVRWHQRDHNWEEIGDNLRFHCDLDLVELEPPQFQPRMLAKMVLIFRDAKSVKISRNALFSPKN